MVAMSPETHALIVTTLLGELRQRLEQAAAMAGAADACARAGGIDQAVSVAQDVEQRTYEANVLLNAASLITRIAKEA